MSDINRVLDKLGLTEDEATIFFNYFAPKFIEENCLLALNLESHSEWEGESEYALIKLSVNVMHDEISLLSDHTYTSVRVS